MTLGDILGVIAAALLLGGSWAATILIVALACPGKVARAEKEITGNTGPCLLRGIGIAVVVGVVAIILFQSHAGPIRLLGGALLTGLGILAVVGSAANTRLLSQRIQEMGSPMTPFASLTRGAVLYVLTGFLPVFGWFLVIPAAACLSIGAGAAAFMEARRHSRPTIKVPPPVAGEAVKLPPGAASQPLQAPPRAQGQPVVSQPVVSQPVVSQPVVSQPVEEAVQ